MAKTKRPADLEIGDRFSYPGSFKVYEVQTEPKECAAFARLPGEMARFVFNVHDWADRDMMGIRLRADVVCTLHEALTPPPLARQLEAIASRGHFEHWGGTWKFWFEVEDGDGDGEPFEGEKIEEVILLAYTMQQAPPPHDPDQT